MFLPITCVFFSLKKNLFYQKNGFNQRNTILPKKNFTKNMISPKKKCFKKPFTIFIFYFGMHGLRSVCSTDKFNWFVLKIVVRLKHLFTKKKEGFNKRTCFHNNNKGNFTKNHVSQKNKFSTKKNLFLPKKKTCFHQKTCFRQIKIFHKQKCFPQKTSYHQKHIFTQKTRLHLKKLFH